MNERIRTLTEMAVAGKLFHVGKTTEYDRADLFLPPVEMSAKRVCAYMANQEPIITEYSTLAGEMRFDGSVEADVFTRIGHKNFGEALQYFYNNPYLNLTTLEWQHSTGDFQYVLWHGINAIIDRIRASAKAHEKKEELEFLSALETVTGGILAWAEKCALRAAQLAETVENPEHKNNLLRLSDALKHVPARPARSFYEAVLCVSFCFTFAPDSLGTADRYLYPFYKHDMDEGILTRETAKAYLQELFVRIQAHTNPKSDRFTRGGESHFCVGGYDENGEDCFNELSYLIVESLMELPLWIPQVSLRWTEKTPTEVLRYMMDCERKDPNKRIAFVNDEPRIKAMTENAGLSYKDAVRYTMVGCNEVALPGGMYSGSAWENIMRCMENTLYNREDEIVGCGTFEDFYTVFESELFADLAEMLKYDDAFNTIRARDVNLISSIFFNGCIENAKSVTQGGADLSIAGLVLIGLTNVIDSLTVIKQFVFTEKIVSMKEMLAALKNNWRGYETLHGMIMKKGRFFGNNDDMSDEIAGLFFDSVHGYLKDKRNLYGHRYLIGNLTGYNQHNTWFGERMRATPDGRFDRDALQFGIGQSEGRDRNGLTALLASVARCDRGKIMLGPTVTNILLDEKLVREEENFEKLVKLFEGYFKMGGVHFQLTYVSKEDLKKARQIPQKYKSLRVRVSGFSDYFTSLNTDLQDEIIKRTDIGRD